MSELLTNKITPATGTAITLGDSGDTLTVPSGATLAVAGTATVGGAAVVTTAPGTSGNVLTSTGSAWSSSAAAGGGGVLQFISKQDGSRSSDGTVTTMSDTIFTSGAEWLAMTTTITPASTSSVIFIMGSFSAAHKGDYSAHLWYTYNHASISELPIQGSLGDKPVTARIENGQSGSDIESPISLNASFSPGTTEAITIKVRTGITSATGGAIYFNQTTNSDTTQNDGSTPISTFHVMEISGDISPSITNTEINT